jgi:hypothetical protein
VGHDNEACIIGQKALLEYAFIGDHSHDRLGVLLSAIVSIKRSEIQRTSPTILGEFQHTFAMVLHQEGRQQPS